MNPMLSPVWPWNRIVPFGSDAGGGMAAEPPPVVLPLLLPTLDEPVSDDESEVDAVASAGLLHAISSMPSPRNPSPHFPSSFLLIHAMSRNATSTASDAAAAGRRHPVA